MPEQMTKQDAIEYLLYMKHDVQAKSPMDIALDTAIEALKQPTIEAEPVRHGRWIIKPHGSYRQLRAFCSACGKHSGIGGIESNQRKPFCPNCGARMDGGADNG